MRRSTKLTLVLSVAPLVFLALTLTDVRHHCTSDARSSGRLVATLPDRGAEANSTLTGAPSHDGGALPLPGSPRPGVPLPGEDLSALAPWAAPGGPAAAVSRWATFPEWLRRSLHDMEDHAFHAHRVLVKFSSGTDDDRRTDVLSRIDAKRQSALGVGDSEEMSRWRLVTLPDTMRVDAALVGLAIAGEAVQCAEPDWQVSAIRVPNDPSYPSLYGMNNTGQTGGRVDADIDAPEAWDLATGTNVIVGMIDTGVQWNHPDLAANIWSNPAEANGVAGVDDDGNGYVDDVRGWDFVNNDNNPTDDNGHGTHTAGTVAAVGNNATGVTGVCWSARLMPLKFLDGSGSGWDSDAIRAIRYATRNGARLTSNSWGGGGASQAEFDAIAEANNAGVLFVAAAGNSGTNNDTSPQYPASFTNPNILAVAATDKYDARASFSCYGATSVDLGAPGVSILSTYPGSSYAYMSGTSMATPHVAGACALLFSYRPASTGTQVKGAILASVDPISSLTGRCVTGGRLNLFRALQNLGGSTPTTHAISGTVTLSGSPLSGVTVTLSGAGSGTATTSSTGTYSFASLVDGAYTVTPSRGGSTFVPTSRSVTLAGADSPANNFAATATPISHAISGAVTVGGSPLSGVTMTLSGAGSGTTTTSSTGTYSFASLADGAYTVTPSRGGYTFAPTNRSVTLVGADSAGNNFAATTLLHSISGAVTLNGSPFSGVTVTLSGAATGTMTTGSGGAWSFPGLADGSYSVTPSRTNYSFSPASLGFTLSGADSSANNFAATLSNPMSISGTVRNGGGSGVSGVTMTLTGGAAAQTTTSASGTWSFGGLADGSYTVTPSGAGLAFSPTSRAVVLTSSSAAGVDFTASSSATTTSTYVCDPAPDLGIQDNSTTTATLILPAGSGTVQDVNVYVDITHTYIGDLVVSVTSPTGTTVILHNRAGGATANLRTWYDTQTAPAQSLGMLVGQGASGVWTLTVADQATQDVGTLNEFRLEVQVSGATGTISGRITVGGTTRAGVAVNASGPAALAGVTDAFGNYSFGALASGTYPVTPTLAGIAFTPASMSVAVGSSPVTGRDFAGATAVAANLPQPVIGLGRGASGQIDILGTATQGYAHLSFVTLPWSEYNYYYGETRVATGDMDGDGRDELLVGIGPYTRNGGWAAVLDDALAGYALRRWIRMSSSTYNSRNGETWPACGDIDGDGRAEMILGTGPTVGYGGFVEVFDDLLTSSTAPIARISTGRSTYNYYSGEVRPACGDVDRDGRAEILFGYGTYPSEGGYVDVHDDRVGGYGLIGQMRVQWSSYNATNGATQVACGDTDGDGQADIVVGLGRGGAGEFEVFGGASGGYAHRAWGYVPWSAYASYDGQTRVACGDLDGDGRAETAVGLGPYPGNGGWVFLFEDAAAGYAYANVTRAGWTTYNNTSGETRPAIGRLR